MRRMTLSSPKATRRVWGPLAAVLAAGLLWGCKPTEPPQAPGPEPTPKAVRRDTGDEVLTTSQPPRTLTPTEVAPPVRPPAPATASTTRKYVVKQGDTLTNIARRELGSDTRVKDIKALNPSIDPNVLKVGQEIDLPAK